MKIQDTREQRTTVINSTHTKYRLDEEEGVGGEVIGGNYYKEYYEFNVVRS